jgi:hypothetical protein
MQRRPQTSLQEQTLTNLSNRVVKVLCFIGTPKTRNITKYGEKNHKSS